MSPHRLLCLAALATSLSCAAPAPAPDRLSAANAGEIAGAALDTLDTSALTLSTLMLGQIDIPPRHPWLARIFSPIAHARSFHLDCPRGGSVKGKLADRDRSEDLSERDRFVTTFSQCQFEAGEPVSGRSEFVVKEHRLEGGLDVTDLVSRFHELGTPALRWSGPADVLVQTELKSGAERRVTTYRTLAVEREGARTYFWSLVVDMRYSPLGDHTAAINGTLTATGFGDFTLLQETPFVVDKEGTTLSGRLLVTGPQGERIRVEATGSGHAISYFGRDNPGDAPDAQSFRPTPAP